VLAWRPPGQSPQDQKAKSHQNQGTDARQKNTPRTHIHTQGRKQSACLPACYHHPAVSICSPQTTRIPLPCVPEKEREREREKSLLPSPSHGSPPRPLGDGGVLEGDGAPRADALAAAAAAASRPRFGGRRRRRGSLRGRRRSALQVRPPSFPPRSSLPQLFALALSSVVL
jgi:hypothetical protein